MVDVFVLGLYLAPVKADPEWRLTNLKMIRSERQFPYFYIQLANICRDRDRALLNALSLFLWKYFQSTFYVLGKFPDAF